MKSTIHLHDAASRQGVNKPDRMVRVGDVVQRLIDNQLSPRQEASDVIDKLWHQLLPEELVRHTRIAGISGSQLKVKVDSPAYMYELQLCCSGLLKEIQRRRPSVRVKEIKLVLA